MQQLLTVLQGAALLFFIGLEYLAGYRAGVMQHLFYNKISHMNGWYAPGNMVLHAGGIVLCFGVCAAVCIRWQGMRLTACVKAFLVMALGLAALAGPWFRELYCYTYLLFVLQGSMMLEAVNALLVLRTNSR